MNHYNTKKQQHGFIGIETIIIATIMLFVGAVSLNMAFRNNDQAGNFINNSIMTNSISDGATGVDIVHEVVEMGVGGNASTLLQWVYQPYPSLPSVAPSNISWTTNPTGVVDVDNNGRMTALRTGTTTVTLSMNVGGSVWSDSVKVNVLNKTLRDVFIRKNEAIVDNTLDIAFTNILTFEYLPWDATINTTTVFSANPAIATATIDRDTQTISIIPRQIGATTITVNINEVTKVIPVNVTMVPQPIPVTAIDIKDGTQSVNFVTVNGSKQLSLHVYPSDATNQDAIISVEDPGIATASINNATKIITINQVSIGTTKMTVTVDGQIKVVSITTSGTALRDFNIIKGAVVVASDWISTNTNYTIGFLPVDAPSATITASSSNTAIATVSVNNTLKRITVNPVTDGNATITVRVGTITKTLHITVSGIRVKTINIKEGEANLVSVTFNGTKTLDIEVLPATAINKTFTATITNTSIATVSVNNTNRTITLTSVATSGSTLLTVSADGISTTIPIQVAFIPLESIEIRDGTTSVASVTVGATKNFNVALNPGNATYNQSAVSITGFDSTIITPTFEAGTKQLRIVPLKAGTTSLLLSIDGKTDTLTITVPEIKATSLDIQSGGVSIVSDSINTAKTYSVVTNPSITTNKAMTASSSNTGVATVSVSGSNFTVTPITNGTAIITVTNTSSGVTDTLTVSVYGFRVETVNIKDGTTTVTSISINAEKTLNVEILPATATNKNITATSANTGIANVSVDNVNKRITLLPALAGTTTVTVTVDGVSRVLTVTVSNIPVTGISITGSNATLTGTRTLTATISPSNATNKGVVWSTSNSARISISSTTGGSITITAVGNGSATITARSAENSTISATITINSDVGQTATSITVGSTLIDSSGRVYRLVDKSARYGTGHSKQSGFNAPVTNYHVWMFESNYATQNWSSSNVLGYNQSTRGVALASASHPLPLFDNLLVRVSIPYHTYAGQSSSLSTMWATLFLPSVRELGWMGIMAHSDGNVFSPFSANGYPTSGIWTRSRYMTTASVPDSNEAIAWVSNNTYEFVTMTTTRAIRPAFALLPSFNVSYYKNASGHYTLR